MNQPEIIKYALITIGALQLLILGAVLAAWYELRAARLRLTMETALYSLDTVFVKGKRSMLRAVDQLASNLRE